MGTQLNIKSDEAYALASELADLTGVSLTQAVLDALKNRKRELSKAEKVSSIMKYCRETANMMSAETLALDIDTYLYDKNGLPK